MEIIPLILINFSTKQGIREFGPFGSDLFSVWPATAASVHRRQPSPGHAGHQPPVREQHDLEGTNGTSYSSPPHTRDICSCKCFCRRMSAYLPVNIFIPANKLNWCRCGQSLEQLNRWMWYVLKFCYAVISCPVLRPWQSFVFLRELMNAVVFESIFGNKSALRIRAATTSKVVFSSQASLEAKQTLGHRIGVKWTIGAFISDHQDRMIGFTSVGSSVLLT